MPAAMRAWWAARSNPRRREIHRQADGLVDDVDGGEEQERRKHQVMGLEPDLAEMRQHEPMKITVVR